MILISAKTYFVTPSSSTPCPYEPCFTLSEYATKPSNYFLSNTILLLLPGNHCLNLELYIEKVTHLSVESTTTTTSDTLVTITCNQSAKFTFQSIDVVDMKGLVLFGCVNNSVTSVEQFTMEHCSLQGQGRKGSGLHLKKVSTANITRSSFSSNTGKQGIDTSALNRVGGAIIVESSKLGITISDSIFTNNTVHVIGLRTKGGAVYCAYSSYIAINNCSFNSNIANDGLGGALYAVSSTMITIQNSLFTNNTGANGGAVYALSSSILIDNSTLNNNTVRGDDGKGGAVFVYDSTLSVANSTISNNVVGGYHSCAGAVYAYSSPITLNNSVINNNTVIRYSGYGGGGAIYATDVTVSVLSPITIVNSTLYDNTVTGERGFGGAVYAELMQPITIVNSTLNSNSVNGDNGAGGAVYSLSKLTIENSTLSNNFIIGDNGIGGALYSDLNVTTIVNVVFSNNTVRGEGAAIHLLSVTLNISGFLDVHNNTANTGVLYAVESTLLLSGNVTISNNYGSLFVYSCNVTFMGDTIIMNNSYLSNTSQEGGAVTVFQSEIFFTGNVNLIYNRAVRGGAIASTQSKLYMYGNVTVSHNTASVSGGGIYAYQSELNFKATINIIANSADVRGGGIHAISSTTRLTEKSKTYIVGNHAIRGGAMCLERSAKIYILKTEIECLHYPSRIDYLCILNTSTWITLHLHNNTADYGGAMYVDDDTNTATCYASPFSDETTIFDECFIQSLCLYNFNSIESGQSHEYLHISNTNFSENSATVAGDVLYGGLLDRCGASPFAEIFQKYTNSASSSLNATFYIINITNLVVQDFNSTKMISSDPVRVCFCKNNQPDCSYNPQPKYVRKGQMFLVSLLAVDHINNTIANSTIIHASVSLDAKLGEGQSTQQTDGDGNCTDLTYVILSPHNSEMLQLYADGPCMSVGISTAIVTVNIIPCPIGFKDTYLNCECDRKIYPEYISKCSIASETVQRKDDVWFAYVNTTEHQGYILHKHCPFDYCHSPTENISVNLNVADGANELCAFNRSGKLCGSCEDGLSLCFGSSRCRPCSNSWIALLIVFTLAGIALVAFIFVFNFTVAEGTFNGLIFYANVFVANRAVFFPRDETKILTVFIAWLNLDFGFETCFYDGMDGYVKTWLQFAFPLYVISLVVAIIIISDYSNDFAGLFTGKNPIQALATLILLSYTKLLRTIIASLSTTTLHYSDGSRELVWMVDANVPYLSGKHIPLFVTALAVVILGLTFTLLLFGWQWLVYCPNRGPLRWIIGNTKVIAFMDAYHNPYNKDHRYWIGLLLLVRVVLYLLFTLNILGDPRINLLSINSAIVILFALQLAVESKGKVHKDILNKMFDIVSLLNLAGLTIINYFITENKDSRNIFAYISTSIALATFVVILIYHGYQFVFKLQYEKLSAKLQVIRERRNKIPVQGERSPSTSTDEESSVGKTEFDVPKPEECLDTMSYMEGDQFEVSIEPASLVKSGSYSRSSRKVDSMEAHEDVQRPLITTENELTHVVRESPKLASYTKPIKNGDHHLVHRKTTSSLLTPSNSPPRIPKARSYDKTSLESKLPKVASAPQPATFHQIQPSAIIVKSTPQDGYETFEEDESTPLLHLPM